jgi:hypothetical protein
MSLDRLTECVPENTELKNKPALPHGALNAHRHDGARFGGPAAAMQAFDRQLSLASGVERSVSRRRGRRQLVRPRENPSVRVPAWRVIVGAGRLGRP